LLANSSASPTCGDVEGDDDLVRDLGRLTVAVASDQRDVLAHLLEQRTDALEHRRIAAAHDGQRRGLGADLAARHRRVDVIGTGGVDSLGERLGRDGRDRAHVDDRLARAAAARLQRGRDSAGPEQDRFDVGRVGNHDEDDLRLPGHLGRVRAGDRARRGDAVGDPAAALDEQLVARIDEVKRHRRSHDPEPDESDLHVCS
jgi:hypothetical protein